MKIIRAMRAEGFRGYQDLKLVDVPKPQMSEGRVLVKIAAAGVTPLEHTILSGGYPRAKAPQARIAARLTQEDLVPRFGA